MFGGSNAEAYNALRSAITTAASDAGYGNEEYGDYQWMDETPGTSMVVEIVNSLLKHGYRIVKENEKLSHTAPTTT